MHGVLIAGTFYQLRSRCRATGGTYHCPSHPSAELTTPAEAQRHADCGVVWICGRHGLEQPWRIVRAVVALLASSLAALT